MDLSIIMVSYNSCELTLNAISSVYQSKTDYKVEIIVVDNNSYDHTLQQIEGEFPDVHLIKSDQNIGFSKANNLGIKASKGDFVLLLNTDTMIESNTIQKMMDFMKSNNDIGASGCKVLLPNGQLDKACKRGFPTPVASLMYFTGLAKVFAKSALFNYYHLGHLDEDEISDVDSLVGAFMIVRRKVIDQVGLLDEGYFMYGEDIDWCYRIKKNGWRIVYYPKAYITHLKGGSSSGEITPKINYEFYHSMKLFYRKHYEKKYSILTKFVVEAGISFVYFLRGIRNKVKQR